MRAYVMTTGAIFGLLALVHLWRMLGPERTLATEPWYVGITLVAARDVPVGLACVETDETVVTRISART